MPRLESFANAFPKMFRCVESAGRLAIVVKPEAEATENRATIIFSKDGMAAQERKAQSVVSSQGRN